MPLSVCFQRKIDGSLVLISLETDSADAAFGAVLLSAKLLLSNGALLAFRTESMMAIGYRSLEK